MTPRDKLEILLAKIVIFHTDIAHIGELSEEQKQDYGNVLDANVNYSLAQGSEEALAHSLTTLGAYYEKWIRPWEG